MKDIYGQKNAAPLTTPLRPYNLKGNEEERQTQKLITALKDLEAIMLDHMFVN